MVYILYGTDQVSAREEAENLAKAMGTKLQFIQNGLPEKFQSDGLFATPNAFLCKSVWSENGKTSKFSATALADLLEDLKWWQESSSLVCIIEKTISKEIAEKLPAGITTKEFSIQDIKTWVIQKSKEYGVSSTPQIAETLLNRLNISSRTFTQDDLWQIQTELQKLITYTEKKPFTVADINLLVAAGEGVVFSAVDAILAGKTKVAFEQLKQLYDTETDEAGVSMQFIGAFADSLKGIRLLQIANTENYNQAEVGEKLGWPTWKLGKLQTLARKIKPTTLDQTIEKISALDAEIKESGLPSRTVLELILADFKV